MDFLPQVSAKRLLLAGDFNTGKTALLARLLTNRFSPTYQPSSSVLNCPWSLPIAGKAQSFLVQDTPGRYEPSVSPAEAVIVVFSCTSPDSLDWAIALIRRLQSAGQAKILLAATKSDEARPCISSVQGLKAAQELGVKFIETSAKSGRNVEICFESAARVLVPAGQDFSVEEMRRALSALEEGTGGESGSCGGTESPPLVFSPDSPNSWDNEGYVDDQLPEETPAEGDFHYQMLIEDVEKCDQGTQTEKPIKRSAKNYPARRKKEDMDKFWFRQFRKYMKKAYFSLKARMEVSEKNYWKVYLGSETKPDKGRRFKSYNSDYRNGLFASQYFRERFGRWFSAEAAAVLETRFDPETSNYETFMEYGQMELLPLCNQPQTSEDMVLTYLA